MYTTTADVVDETHDPFHFIFKINPFQRKNHRHRDRHEL